MLPKSQSYDSFRLTEKLDPSLVRTEGRVLTVRFNVTNTKSYTDELQELMAPETPLAVTLLVDAMHV